MDEELNKKIQEIIEAQSNYVLNESSATQSQFDNLVFPMIRKVFPQMIAHNIVPVSPLGGGLPGEEIRRIDTELRRENREGKIESLVEGKEYVEKKRQDHPDWIEPEGPKASLLHFDYSYNSGTISTI
jgi:hypothetical protein